MKIRLIILLVYSLSVLSVQAQKGDKIRVSGYLGHKTFVFGGMETMISYQPQKAEEIDPGITLNKTFLAGVQRVVTNRASLSLKLAYATTASNRKIHDLSSSIRWRENNGEYTVTTNQGQVGIQVLTAGFEWTLFRKRVGGLAPMGWYIGLGANYHMNSYSLEGITADAEVVYSNNSVERKTFDLSGSTGSSSLVEGSVRLGRSHPLTKKLLLDVYGKFGYLFAPTSPSLSETTIGKDRLVEGLVIVQNQRLFDMFLFNFGARLNFAL